MRVLGVVLWWVRLPIMLVVAGIIYLSVKVFGQERVIRADRWLGRLQREIRP